MASRIRWSASRRKTFAATSTSSRRRVPCCSCLSSGTRGCGRTRIFATTAPSDWVRIHGRLDPGVDIRQANALVSATVAGLAQQLSRVERIQGGHRRAVHLDGRGRSSGEPARGQHPARAWWAAVLLIVCLNISGMMLVRGASRERELSIRAALGADRRRLIQHLFFEAILLAFASGALSAFVLFGIPAIAGWYLGVPVPQEIDFDATGVADLDRTLPAGERALRLVAGGSLQPSQPDSRDEGGCRRRRTPDDSRASRRGDGANRHRRPVSRRSAA